MVKSGADLYSVPVEAFKRNNPYPFGVDPVSSVLHTFIYVCINMYNWFTQTQ